MGGPEFSQTFGASLEQDCEELYANFQKHNESKNIFAAARSPAVLFTIMLACYVVSGMLGILGLETLANIVNLVMGIALVLLSTWAYVRYSGEHRELGGYIDKLTDIVWEMVSSGDIIENWKEPNFDR